MLKHQTTFLIVGESGSGKTSLCNILSEEKGMKQLWSYTTRNRRYDGEPGHVFVPSMGVWQALNPTEIVVGYTHFAGHDYWATAKQVDESDLYVIDVDGVDFFKKNYAGHKNIKVVYIRSSVLERATRMLSRGDGLISTARRLINDAIAFRRAAGMADKVIRNREFSEAFGDLWHYIWHIDGEDAVIHVPYNQPCEKQGSYYCLNVCKGEDDDGAIYCGRDANDG